MKNVVNFYLYDSMNRPLRNFMAQKVSRMERMFKQKL